MYGVVDAPLLSSLSLLRCRCRSPAAIAPIAITLTDFSSYLFSLNAVTSAETE